MENNIHPNNEQEEKLLVKLLDNLTTLGHASKCVVKKVWQFVLTKALPIGMGFLFTFSPVALTGCKNKNTDSNIDSGYVESDTPSSSDTSNPGSSDTSTPGTDDKKPDYSNYSNILKTVLQDSYYNGLIAEDKAQYANGNTTHYQKGKYKAVPYGFLEDEGLNISKYKNSSLETKSEMYLDGNDLYVELRAEVEGSTNYYNNYVLKYTLTNQEIKELNALFSQADVEKTRTFYQAAFFIQELSYQKDAEVISEANITKESLKIGENHFGSVNYIAPTTSATYIGSEFKDNEIAYHTFQIHELISNRNSHAVKGEMEIGTITFKTWGYGTITVNSNTVFANTNPAAYELLSKYNQAFEASKKTVTYYSCENARFADILTSNRLENELNK